MSAICPECRDGKCHNCDSTAWDLERDIPTACACWAHDHNQGDLP